jgi:hypothetical protein
MLALRNGNVPQTISTSYSDDEQTGKNNLPCLSFCFLYYNVGLGYRIVLIVRRYPELTFASFLVPQDYAVRVCKEFALLGEPCIIIQ